MFESRHHGELIDLGIVVRLCFGGWGDDNICINTEAAGLAAGIWPALVVETAADRIHIRLQPLAANRRTKNVYGGHKSITPSQIMYSPSWPIIPLPYCRVASSRACR